MMTVSTFARESTSLWTRMGKVGQFLVALAVGAALALVSWQAGVLDTEIFGFATGAAVSAGGPGSLVAIGAAFVIGDQVKGGMYGEYPSAKAEDLEQGDLVPNYDFRGAYTSIVEDWFGLDAKPIVNGSFEKLGFL